MGVLFQGVQERLDPFSFSNTYPFVNNINFYDIVFVWLCSISVRENLLLLT